MDETDIDDLRRECREMAGRVQALSQLVRVLLRRLALESADPVAELDAAQRRAIAFMDPGEFTARVGPEFDAAPVSDEIKTSIELTKRGLTA